jgi:TonB-linked SusC/RagA family outer membrane protein
MIYRLNFILRSMLGIYIFMWLNISSVQAEIQQYGGSFPAETLAERMERLNELGKETGQSVSYNMSELKNKRIPALTPTTNNMEEWLYKSLENTEYTYEKKSNNLFLVVKGEKEALPQSKQTEQTREVRGTVVDAHQTPLVGVNVVQKGTTNGTVTDLDGTFSFQATPNSTLVFTYIGFAEREVVWDGKNPLNVTLSEDTELLDEVVVVGYGVQKKSDLTGAIVSVNREKIESVPVTNLAAALQGQVPGLMASNTSWNPGDSPEIFIRGKRSISASNDPLFVVDGITMTSGINALNQYDIESIEVLKDASATAIYGSRGANGVILITTKQGSEGKTTIDYSGYVGVQTIQNRIEMMNGGEYAEYTREAYRNSTRANRYLSDTPDMEQDKLLPMFRQDPYVLESVLMGYDSNGNYNPANVRSHDWFSDITQDALITNHSLNVRGGGKKTNFMVSASYNYTDGIVKDKEYQRYTIRTNLDHSINDYIKIGTQSQYANYVQQRGSEMERDSYQYRITPLGKFRNEDNTLPMLIGADPQMYNPLLNLEPGAIDRPLKKNQFLGNFYVELMLPIDGLRFRSNLGLDFNSVQNYEFFAKETTPRQNGSSYARNATSHKNMYTWENYFTYDKIIKDIHRFNFTLLQSIQQDVNEASSTGVENLPSNALKYYDLGAGLLINHVNSDYNKWNLASFMGRVNYNLSERYLFTLSARYDGASRLAEGHKWVLFPSAAFAWRLNEEQFMSDISWMSNLKVRLGFGKTGNSAIDPYQTKGIIDQRYYVFGNGATEVIGYTPSEMVNENLTWETTDQWNAGLDFAFFRSRINGSVDFYLQNTHDLLLERQLPVVSGYSSVMSNVGKTRNKGVEIFINTRNINNQSFTWSTDLIFSYNKQEIVELYNGKVDDIGNAWFIGQPIDVYYYYKKIGIWQDTPEELEAMRLLNENGGNFKPGKIKLLDVNGDKKINDEDRVILGQRYPKIMAALNNQMKYKNFDLSVMLYSNFGGMLKNSFEFMEKPGRANTMAFIDYWTPTNPTNAFPRPSVDQESVDYADALGFDKSDFVRVRNITLGYTLPTDILRRMGISQMRLYLSANNPYIFTNFTGIDPEGAAGETSPSVSTWMFGINTTF